MPETTAPAIDFSADADLITFLKAIPDGRYRRGVRYPQWYLLLVAVLGILSDCRSSRDLEAFAERHREVLNQALGLNFKRWPSDATFLYLFNKTHLQQFGQVLQAWMISQIPGGATALEQLVCVALGLPRSGWQDLEGFSDPDRGRPSPFCRSGDRLRPGAGRRPGPEELRHPRIQRTDRPQRAAEHDGSGWQADPGGCPAHHAGFFRWCLKQGADLVLTVKTNQPRLHRQISRQFEGKRHIPFTATNQEEKHGRDTSWELRAKEAPDHIKETWPGSAWIVELITTTTKRNGKCRVTRHYYGLRPTASTSQP